MGAAVGNRLWEAACVPAERAFRRALADPVGTQERLLLAHVRANAETEVGRRFGFSRIRSAADFRERVPLHTWDDLAHDAARIARGTPRVWTADRVRRLEPTSGTSGGTKLVPYTDTMRQQVRAAVGAWMADLFRAMPDLRGGPAYWSVSPAVPLPAAHAGGPPVGFDSDGGYLSPLHARLARAVMAAPDDLRHVLDSETHRYATLRTTIARADLRLISVWNPTALALLLAPLRPWSDRLAHDLRRGTLTPAVPLPPGIQDRLARGLRPDPRRADSLLAAVRDEPDDGVLHARLWPRLGLVSAWGDGHAAGSFEQLRALVPHARIQAKGLLATEGVVSIPRVGHDGGALALTSHVVELLDGGQSVDLARADVGGLFEVALTMGGGLLRYRLGDRVRVVGHAGRCPLVRFVERAGPVSDRVGEKLHEAHVAACVAGLGLDAPFTLVACDTAAGDGAAHRARPPAYVLFAETCDTDARLAAAARALDAALSENIHYAHARRLGQLGPLRAFRVRGDGAEAFVAGCVALGQRAGSVKPAALHRDGGWAERFDGAFVDAAPALSRGAW
ncbi:MAG TPA: GH3 auxin-responsive promoter family protein [Rubricoccaceae bacterium]|jgi:hypothetical protein